MTEPYFGATKLTTVEAMKLIAETTFTPFDAVDWARFAGCETKEPLIGFNKPHTIVIDGDSINIIHDDERGGGLLFALKFEAVA